MRRKMIVALLSIFILAFAIGAMMPAAQAGGPCIACCINGQLLVCCPMPGGGWDCYWDGPCDWGGMIP
ncbi:MAG: hypothetical protein GY839_15005 [candidate division Zixibacteria bacterium]|nr:hypothetical protein [candidate division Zixibacteria bacterium]